MNQELLIKNLIIFPLIGLAREPNVDFFRNDKKIKQYLSNLVDLYRRQISSNEVLISDILDQVKKSFYSEEYINYFIQQLDKEIVIDNWDIIDLDTLIQGYKTNNRDLKKYIKWEKDKRNNKNSITGFFTKDFEGRKIDYYILKLGFDNYAQAKSCDFDITKKQNTEKDTTPILERLLKLVGDSQETIRNEIIATQKSIKGLQNTLINNVDNNSIETNKKLKPLSQKLKSLEQESSDNFKILQKKQNDSSEKLIDKQKKLIQKQKEIDKTLDNISSDYIRLNGELKKKIDSAKKEIVQNQNSVAQDIKTSNSKNFRSLKRFGGAIAGIILIVLLVNTFIPKSDIQIKGLFDEKFDGFESENINTFKLLLLPFNADKICESETSNYEIQLYRRFNSIQKQDEIDLEIGFLKTITPPQDKFEAVDLGKKYDADMIIWGYYEEECEANTKITLHYHLSEKIQKISSKVETPTKLKPLPSLKSMRNGIFQGGIDNVIFWVLAQYYRKSGENHKGLKAINHILKADNYDPATYFLAYMLAFSTHNFDLIESYGEKIIKGDYFNNPDKNIPLKELIQSNNYKSNSFISLMAWSFIAQKRAYEKKDSEALIILKKLIRDYPSYTDTYYMMAEMYKKNNSLNQALLSYDLAIKRFNPENKAIIYKKDDILLSKGIILKEMKLYNEALDVIKEAHSLNPNNIKITYQKAHLSFAIGSDNPLKKSLIEDSLLDIDKVLNLQPNSIDALGLKVMILLDLEKNEEADITFRKMKSLKPNSKKVRIIKQQLILSKKLNSFKQKYNL